MCFLCAIFSWDALTMQNRQNRQVFYMLYMFYMVKQKDTGC